jgi:hypothetical protein
VTVASSIRRVVTGKDATGKAIAMIDAVATTVHRREELGITNTLLWVTDSIPADLSNREDGANKRVGVIPPPGGTILRVIEFAPEREVKTDYEPGCEFFKASGSPPKANHARSLVTLPCTGQKPSTMLSSCPARSTCCWTILRFI